MEISGNAAKYLKVQRYIIAKNGRNYGDNDAVEDVNDDRGASMDWVPQPNHVEYGAGNHC